MILLRIIIRIIKEIFLVLFLTSYGRVFLCYFISFVAVLICKIIFKKYDTVCCEKGFSSQGVVKMILHSHGITDVTVGATPGNLTDHYRPSTREMKLSESVYGKESVAAIGIAAHECGHALQHNSAYFPLKIRSAIAPVIKIVSLLSMPILILGLWLEKEGFTGLQELTDFGMLIFCLIYLVQLLSLPIEFNASRRAVRELENGGYLNEQELVMVRKVLFAAAMTYVTSIITTYFWVFRQFSGTRGSGRR